VQCSKLLICYPETLELARNREGGKQLFRCYVIA
jgi:hypothetical protein